MNITWSRTTWRISIWPSARPAQHQPPLGCRNSVTTSPSKQQQKFGKQWVATGDPSNLSQPPLAASSSSITADCKTAGRGWRSSPAAAAAGWPPWTFQSWASLGGCCCLHSVTAWHYNWWHLCPGAGGQHDFLLLVIAFCPASSLQMSKKH